MSENRPMIPSVSVKYAHDGHSAAADALGMRPMQARVCRLRVTRPIWDSGRRVVASAADA